MWAIPRLSSEMLAGALRPGRVNVSVGMSHGSVLADGTCGLQAQWYNFLNVFVFRPFS